MSSQQIIIFFFYFIPQLIHFNPWLATLQMSIIWCHEVKHTLPLICKLWCGCTLNNLFFNCVRVKCHGTKIGWQLWRENRTFQRGVIKLNLYFAHSAFSFHFSNKWFCFPTRILRFVFCLLACVLRSAECVMLFFMIDRLSRERFLLPFFWHYIFHKKNFNFNLKNTFPQT